MAERAPRNADLPAGGTPDSDAADEMVAVGRIGPARGVRGEVFVEPWTDAPEERFAPGVVLRTTSAAVSTLTVVTADVSSGKQVVRFEGVSDRVTAESLRGLELLFPAAERRALDDPEEFYVSDLVGLAAVDVAGAPLGPVLGVQHAGGTSYLVVEVAGRERLIPFVAAIVPSVDVAAGTVTVDPPEGLFEL